MAYHIRVSESGFPQEAKAQDDLARMLGNEWLILSNPQRTRTGAEIDCLVLGPRGLINIELKNWADDTVANDGGRWQFNGKDATYKSKNATHERLRPDPVKQAQNAARSFKEHFKAEYSVSLWVDYCTLAGPLGIKLDYKDLKVKDIARPLQEAVGLLERRIERGKTDHKLGCIPLTRENALAVLKHFSVDTKLDAQQWLKSAYRETKSSLESQPKLVNAVAPSAVNRRSPLTSGENSSIKNDTNSHNLIYHKHVYPSDKNLISRDMFDSLLTICFIFLFPFVSYVISLIFAEPIKSNSLKLFDVTRSDRWYFLFPVLNWIGFLSSTVTHTVYAVFSDGSQAKAIWIGHLSAFVMFLGASRIFRYSSGIASIFFSGAIVSLVIYNHMRDRPGDRELRAIVQQIGFRSYSNTLNFPNQPGNVTLTLTSDGENLKLDSLSAGHACSYSVSADGLQGSRVALELEVIEGDCRKLTGEVYSNGEVIDFDLFTGNNRRVPMQFRINSNE
jgi:hypothetical protein